MPEHSGARTVLVTGAARRIGATIAEALAADGWRVLAHYHSSATDAEGLRDRIRLAGGWCELLCTDLMDAAAVRRMIPQATAQFGRIDALVNNASSFRYDTVHSMDAGSWAWHLRPNLESPLFLARDLAEALGDNPGIVVNMLDHKVSALNPDFFSYTVAKIGMAGATRLLAQAFRGRVRVCGVAPGITLLSGKQTEAGFERAWTAPPLGRSSTPAELANAVRFILATPSCNGQMLVLDGGESLVGRQRDIAFEKS